VGHGRRNCRRLDQMMAFLAKLADEPDVVLHVLFTWTSWDQEAAKRNEDEDRVAEIGQGRAKQ
jgi:hypothetical protein